MTTVYKFQSELEEVDEYAKGFNDGFKAGLEAAKQSIVKVIEEENKNDSQ